MKYSKYSNIKTGKYDSKKESKRAGELKLLLKAGIIKELEEQKVFVCSRQRSCKRRKGKYVAYVEP